MNFKVECSGFYGNNTEGLMNDVIEELAEKIEGWKSYNVEYIENIYPLKRYYLNLHEGEIENPGEIKHNIIVDINQETKEAQIEVQH